VVFFSKVFKIDVEIPKTIRRNNLLSKKTSDISVSNKPKARSENLLVQNSDKELLVYDLKTNKAICLNETSALIWQQCDGTKNENEIAKEIGNKLGHTVKTDLVRFAIDQLRKENLLENSERMSETFAGLSRREVIRKVGLSSMIALPMVSAILAPTSVYAQSCVGMGANFPPGQQTAGGTIPSCPTSTLCDTQGANCCTGVAAIMCLGPAGPSEPFTCNCT